MSAAGFRGRGLAPRGRRDRGGPPTGVMGARNPQPNFNQPRRAESHVSRAEFWMEHAPSDPWQQINGLPLPQAQQYSGFESHRYRGRPQFCPGIGARGRSKRIRGEGRSRPGMPPSSGFGGVGLARPESEPVRFPPLGSEEERQQKIAETADKLKQKLSSLTVEEPVNFWEDDISGVSFSNDEEHLIASKGIPELRHDPPELNLTINDFKDIGRVDPDFSLNSGDCVEVLPFGESRSEVRVAEDDQEDPEILLEDQRNNKNCNQGVKEPPESILDDDEINESTKSAKETTTGLKQSLNSSRNDLQIGKVDQTVVDQSSTVIEKEAIKSTEKKSISELKPELTKSLEKLREVIKVDRQLENEGQSGVHTENRSIFQPNAGPRLQPDVRLDFHPGIGPGYPRFQGFGHGGVPHEMRGRFRGQFRSEHPMEMQPNFGPDFPPRFERRPDPGSRNFNLPQRPPGPRMIHTEFGGPMHHRMLNRNPDQLGFDRREPPPRFNGPPRQEAAWFNRNEVPSKYGLNGLRPPPGFDLRGPPPIFMNQEREPALYGPNIHPNSEFSQIVPMGYPPIQRMHIGHQTGYFNLAMPPPNTAPCIMPEFLPPSVPPTSPMDGQSALQPPPMPIGALDMQTNILRGPPSPPSLPPQIDDQNPTPNMNEELEDMQEALEFAKKLMNMTEEEEDITQTFDMPTFPDLPPIPSTEPSHLAEKHELIKLPEPITQKEENIPAPIDESMKEPSFPSEETEDPLDDLLRPKVTFNLTSRTKRIAKVDEWHIQNEGTSSRERISLNRAADSPALKSPSEDKCDKTRENRNNKKNRMQLRENEPKDTSGQKENRVENVTEISSKTIEDKNPKVRASTSKPATKSLSASIVDANWKDKVINQFLKMSKNDICNMVNSSGLRKFDIAMKHLVKERKNSLSHERRCSADDVVKDMSREEFMSQLSAMLDPSATVDVKNLPSKFIQHLSEVLKLDVESHLNDGADPVEANDELNNISNADLNLDDVNRLDNCEPESFMESSAMANYENPVRNVITEIQTDQDPEMSADFSHLFMNADNSLGEIMPSMDAIDDIFSAGIARAKEVQKAVTHKKNAHEASREIEGEFITHGLIRARCTRTLMSDENVDLDNVLSAGIARSEKTVITNIVSGSVAADERGQVTIEGEEGWDRNKQQDPDMFRNLTKEEWEARCARSMEFMKEKEYNNLRSRTPSSRDTSLSARSNSPRNIDKGLKSNRFIRNLSPPTPFRENNYNLNIVVHTANDAADKWSKATEEETLLMGSDSFGPSSCGSISSNSNPSTTTKSSKLLNVMKEQEKMTRDMSLSEIIKNQATAELESATVREMGSEIDRKNRKREKNRMKKERKEKRKEERKKRTSFEIRDEVRITPVDESSKHEAFIKQEELIIEADSEHFFETTNNLTATDQVKNPNSHSTVDRYEETLSEVSFQEHNDSLPHFDTGLKSQEMLVAQEYATHSAILELNTDPFSHNLYKISDLSIQKPSKFGEIEGPVLAENIFENLEQKEPRNRLKISADIKLSKSGAKKIDIKAYKARKLQRNTQKVDRVNEIEASIDSMTAQPGNVPCLSEVAEENLHSGDLKPRIEDKLEDKNPVENLESGLKKELLLDRQDSSPPHLHKEKSTVPSDKSDKILEKRAERKPSKKTSAKDDKKSNEKLNSDEKVDKKQSKLHLRDKERSTSREDNRRTGKEKSKHSTQVKATHQNNNIVESKDRKTSRHKSCNSPKKTNERIEKRHSKSKEDLAEERLGDEETKRKNESMKESASPVSNQIVMDKRKEQKEDLENVNNCDPDMEMATVEQNCEEISTCVTETAEVVEKNPEITTMELNTGEKSSELESIDMENKDYVVLSPSQSQNNPPTELANETTNPDAVFHVENLARDDGKESSITEDHSVQNELKDSSPVEEEILKLEVSKDSENETASEFRLNETAMEPNSLESTEKRAGHEAEKSLEVLSELETKQSCDNIIKSILNDLIDKAISQLDLLNGKNEAKETIAKTETTCLLETELLVENVHNSKEFTGYTILELKSPVTPESPLKGFSEETITSSILGKRRLAQSVLEITEDYMQNKRSKDFDNIVPDIIVDDLNTPHDNEEQSPEHKLEVIDAESQKMQIESANCLQKSVPIDEPESKVDDRKDCTTPSGDTLSLGSSIDFDNGEFIVLSEISSDENFSQDENRRLDINMAVPESQELAEIDNQNDEQERGKTTRENEQEDTLSEDKGLPKHKPSTTSRELRSTKTSRNTKDTKGKLSVKQDNAKLSAPKNSDQLSDSEFKLKEDDDNGKTGDTAANIFVECQAETIEQSVTLPSEGTENLGSCELLNSTLSSNKTPAIEDDNDSRNISDCKKLSKSNEMKHVNISSNENSVNKNLHKIRHRHRMKHKKEKRYKPSDKKHIKEALKEEELVTVVKKQQTKEGVMARMIEIDLEIHKLMSEKMKLYQMLENGEFPNEQSLAVGKNVAEPLLEMINMPRREPDSNPSNNEAGTSLAKQKSSSSKTGTESSASKSTKTRASCTSEDDIGNKHSLNQRDPSAKKSKKSHRHERPSRPHSKTESRKVSAAKSSNSKMKNTDDKSTIKKDNHSRSSSSSNRRKEEETLRNEENHGRKNVSKETADENATGICQKSKKAEHHHSGQRKKTNKLSDSKEDPLPRMKKEGPLSNVNDDIELRSGTVCESVNIVQEKVTPPQIYSDESSQVSLSQEYKVDKKAPKGLALLEETYKRERAVARKRRAVIVKENKERIKSLQKSGSSLTPSDEEMPLNLLYVKKFQKKTEPVNNAKLKRVTSAERLEHVLQVINAVAQNKTDEYQPSNKVKVNIEAMADINVLDLNRKTKVVSKTKPSSDNGRHSAIDESQVISPVEDIPGGKNTTEHFLDDNLRDFDGFNVIGSKSSPSLKDSVNKFPIDKIIEISRENNGADIAKNKSRKKSVSSRGEIDQLSLLGNIHEEEMAEAESRQNSWRHLRNEGILSLNHAFNYSNDIPQFDDSDLTFMPQDQTSHSHSISRNFKDIEKGLDVLDSMLETVSSDLEGISSKDVTPSCVKKGKKKRMVSGGSGVDGDVLSRKKKAIIRLDLKNCSVRLVDCRYTYLKPRTSSPKKTDDPQPPEINSLNTQSVVESQAQTTGSESSTFLPKTHDQKHQLDDDAENLPLLRNEDNLIAESDFSLNHMEVNSVYDDDDLEIIKLNHSSLGTEDMVEACRSTTLSEVRNWQSLEKIQACGYSPSEFDAERTMILDYERTNSPTISSDSPTTGFSVSKESAELALEERPFSKLKDLHVDQENNSEILASEISVVGEDRAPATCNDDIQVINSPREQEIDDVQEVELPRIQYSVHKGPILDVKVFGDSILAASEDGVIYRYSQTCNGILNTYEGHKSAVTCIYVLQGTASTTGTTKDRLFSGSLDGSLRCFDIMTSHPVRGAADVGSSVQCMDQSWGVIFLGTKSGYVSRFDIKLHAFKGDEIKFSEESVLALKATTEGPRRVLIVASRSQPITIRDAQTGLFLRTVSGHKSHTVYSLMMDSNLVYCGTSNTAIAVFDFINGSEVKLYNAGPGIVCMRMYKWLLFAGCYDGNIYVFDTKEQKLVCSIPGPGNMLLSMDIVKNKIVAGSKDRRLHIWQMPEQVLSLLAGRT